MVTLQGRIMSRRQRPLDRSAKGGSVLVASATRAVGRGLTHDALCVFFLETPRVLPDADVDRPDDIARIAEWVINQWNHPVLGRR